MSLKIHSLGSILPEPANDKAHHVGAPPTGFRNPWPSAGREKHGLLDVLSTRFGNNFEKTNVPLPHGINGERSTELVNVQTPDWASQRTDKLRATWIGHASYLVETPVQGQAQRGFRVLFDPVFAERMSPVSWAGPKRFTPTPCTLEELPDVDVIVISHDHYDHLDLDAVKTIYQKRKGNIHIVAALGNRHFFIDNAHCAPQDTTELDWWDSIEITSTDPNVQSTIKLTCCPAQHNSGRTAFNRGSTLWCSWALEAGGKKLYFAGDTGYQAYGAPSPCPAFKQIGEQLGPFDLSLLPIGCYKPASFMAEVHVSPAQSLQIHKDVKSRFSVGMHYMTIRGALSAAYEAVQDPARDWREFAEKENLWCGGGVQGDGSPADVSKGGVGLCHVGETICV